LVASGHQLHDKFVKHLLSPLLKHKNSISDRHTLVATLDFFCVATLSQPRFVETCFHQSSSFNSDDTSEDALGKEILDFVSKAQERDDAVLKLIVLFKLMAQQNICHNLIKYKDFEIIKVFN